MTINEYLQNVRSGMNLASVLVCNDGFAMSVQASSSHYCTPCMNDAEYSAVEIGFPSQEESALMPYAENEDKPTETVYGWVPVEVVEEIIKLHGGIKQ